MVLLFCLGTLSWQVSPKRPERNLPPPSCVGDPCHASLPISLVSPKVGTTEMQTQGTGRVAYVVVFFFLLFIRERPRACVGNALQLGGVRQIGCWDKNRAPKEVLRQSHFVGDTCFRNSHSRAPYLVTTVFWSILALRSSFCCWRTWIFSSRIMFFSAYKRRSVKRFSARLLGFGCQEQCLADCSL